MFLLLVWKENNRERGNYNLNFIFMLELSNFLGIEKRNYKREREI